MRAASIPFAHRPDPPPSLHEVQTWLDLLFGGVDHKIEVRAPKCRVVNRPKNVVSRFGPGKIEDVAGEVLGLSGNAPAVYVVMNGVSPAMPLGRDLHPGASAADIPRRLRMLVDVDPVRFGKDGKKLVGDEGKVNSTAAEKAAAYEVALAIRDFLVDIGWPEPIIADSGNGYHLIFHVDLPADDVFAVDKDGKPTREDGPTTELVKRVLEGLAGRFDTAAVEVDRRVFDLPRLVKCYGTWACKGDETPERPGRYARVLSIPDAIIPVPFELLEAVAPQVSGDVLDGFDLADDVERKRGQGHPGPNGKPHTTGVSPGRKANLDKFSDEELLAWARNAKNGAKFSALYAGDRSGYESDSEADCALLVLLAYWTGGDAARMERLFDGSGLAGRGKWSERPDYRTRSIAAAIELNAGKAPDLTETVLEHDDKGGGPSCKLRQKPPPTRPRWQPPLSESEATQANGDAQTGPSTDGDDLPVIVCSDVSLALATKQAVKAIAAKNEPPVVFNTGGGLSRIKQTAGEDSRPVIDLMSQDALRNRCAEVATFLEVTKTSKGAIEREVFPPKDIVRAVLALPRWSNRVAPPLNSIAEVPRFQRDGRLITVPGYHPGSRLYYAPLIGMDDLRIPPIPTAAEVDDAKALVFDEYLVNFPFGEPSSKANALACMLVPFVRDMIPGPTPLHLVEASTEGTGKGKLANACAFPALGRELTSTPQKEDEAEWRKALTTAFASGVDPIYFDNMFNPRGWDDTLLPIDSGTLAAALTQTIWRDRILGVSKDATIPIRAVFMASGNNLEWSKELKRRIVSIALRAPVENPSERTGFKHDPIEAWAAQHHRDLVRACLILCQNWIAEDRPKGRQVMGSYEEYARVMGGILEAALVPGFLENRPKGGGTDRESIRWAALVEAWHAKEGPSPVSSSQLHELIFGTGSPPLGGNADLQVAFADMGEGSLLSQKQRLGNAMRKQEGRVWGDHRIVLSAAKGSGGTLLYKLVPPSEGEDD